MLSKNIFLILIIFVTGCSKNGPSIIEENKSLKTYPFSEPNPIPILSKDRRLYPYHSFMGYSHEGTQKEWKVVTMENEHIEVSILPEVGGKVWGAIDKSNGEEFIYRNEVMKFRNIALRGPWTSGGIEFNFGIIGGFEGGVFPGASYLWGKTHYYNNNTCLLYTSDAADE